MADAIEQFVRGVALPAAIACAAVLLAVRLLSGEAARRYAATLGFALAFCIGYVLLPDWAELIPARHWHWLPYLVSAAALTGPIGRAAGLFKLEGWILNLLLSIVAAWLIVPGWSSLSPPRTVYIPALASYLFLLTVLLESLAERLPAARLSGLLCLASLCLSAGIAAFVSFNYGRISAAATGALAGIALAAWRQSGAVSAAATAPAYATVVGGMAFVACIEPQQPLYGLLIIPAAPLSAYLPKLGPMKATSNRASLLVQTALVLGVAIAAMGLVQFESAAGD